MALTRQGTKRTARARFVRSPSVAVAALALLACEDNSPAGVRHRLYAELQPVALRDCTLKRYGGPSDGGYLMCENLMSSAVAAYSYGIDAEDEWGCQVSRELKIRVEQYDCFTPHRPAPCRGGNTHFHDECVGPTTQTAEGELFDTIANQIAKNGHASQPILLKIDVEGAEWDALLATPDEVLARIDQLPMEFHGTDEQRYLTLVRRLKKHFYLVNLHYNNHACTPHVQPFPGWAFQVLWVNKRLGEVDPSAPVPAPSSPLNAPDNPDEADCQAPPERR